MGNGVVLESGTHDELLSREGAYHRLVQAQKLREGQDSAAGGSEASEKDDMGKAAREEVPLGRRNTGRSLASEIIDQKRQEAAEVEAGKQEHTLWYIFKRMAPLIRDKRKAYLYGSFFACCAYISSIFNSLFSFVPGSGMVYPAFGIVYAKGIEGFSLVDRSAMRKAGDRNALW